MHYPVGRSRWLGAGLALCALAGAGALGAWALWGAGTQRSAVVAGAAVWVLCSLCAGQFWRAAPVGTLVWSGVAWTLESPQGLALCAPAARVQVALDLQQHLWLCLQPGTGRPLWLWLERRSQPARWDDLRRAVYSRVASGDPAASRLAPPSGPQA